MKEKSIIHKGVKVYYTDQGEGPCIVLLHGYLESSKIWAPFSGMLAEQFRVICVDLPGHGKSGTWGIEHSMDDLAGTVSALTETEEVEKIFLVGHSMGGYVTMAFADLFPEKLLGYVLFHSTCFADTQEKKENRDREISLVLCGKKHQIVNVNIPKAFADDNAERLGREVAQAQAIALHSPDQGVVALLNGMRNRPDRSATLAKGNIPLLLIGGKKDNYIPLAVFEKLKNLAPHATSVLLPNSGHMGFVEEAETAADAIAGFMEGHMK